MNAMPTSERTTTFNSSEIEFERRNHKVRARFPLVDCDGATIKHDRRIEPSLHLSKIELIELELQEDEFKNLFNK